VRAAQLAALARFGEIDIGVDGLGHGREPHLI
jgi:hypothetical protein